MIINQIKHTGVKKDGTFRNGGGAVTVKEEFFTSTPVRGGCNGNTCNCSAGHWFSITAGREPDETVSVANFVFESEDKMKKFLTDMRNEINAYLSGKVTDEDDVDVDIRIHDCRYKDSR